MYTQAYIRVEHPSSPVDKNKRERFQPGDKYYEDHTEVDRKVSQQLAMLGELKWGVYFKRIDCQ
jgi:hypothetical protein